MEHQETREMNMKLTLLLVNERQPLSLITLHPRGQILFAQHLTRMYHLFINLEEIQISFIAIKRLRGGNKSEFGARTVKTQSAQ